MLLRIALSVFSEWVNMFDTCARSSPMKHPFLRFARAHICHLVVPGARVYGTGTEQEEDDR